MNRGRSSIIGAVLILCSALLLVPNTVRAEETSKRIAVVNVSRVFAAYQRVKDVQTKMESLFEPDRKGIEKESADLKKQEDIIRLNPSDPKKDINFFKQIQQFELRKAELDVKFQDLYQRVEDRRKDEMKKVLNEIKAAIRFVGTAEKFDLILRAPEFDDEFDDKKTAEEKKDEPKSAADLVRRFRENPVMYFSQGVEVTDKVITKLNDDYKNTINSESKKDK
jgi:Skp family chaperone for outer membrane proteins